MEKTPGQRNTPAKSSSLKQDKTTQTESGVCNASTQTTPDTETKPIDLPWWSAGYPTRNVGIQQTESYLEMILHTPGCPSAKKIVRHDPLIPREPDPVTSTSPTDKSDHSSGIEESPLKHQRSKTTHTPGGFGLPRPHC